jgi:hypothetical protein
MSRTSPHPSDSPPTFGFLFATVAEAERSRAFHLGEAERAEARMNPGGARNHRHLAEHYAFRADPALWPGIEVIREYLYVNGWEGSWADGLALIRRELAKKMSPSAVDAVLLRDLACVLQRDLEKR